MIVPAKQKKTAIRVLFLILILAINPSCESVPKRVKNPQSAEEQVVNYLMARKVDPPKPPKTKGTSIVVDTSNQRAWLFSEGSLALTSPITPGKPSSPTPKGKYHVIKKHEDWTSTIYGVGMPYFLRLNPWFFGLHEGPMSIKPASHGCIRLPTNKAKEFFNATPIGTPVWIY
jgi:lipoprotein-anchoring transpeptidase ErfK/SrfK